MAYTFLSRFKVRDDKQDEFIDLARKMEKQAPDEPGTLHFQFFRLGDPGMFAVLESFVDEAADKAHMEYAQNKPLIDGMIACMDGSYERELLFDLGRHPEG
ncbi:putative quinol monooxygenase [Croceicoccus gelatinilyticus]|uniref:putative quinol monooxygenase n=1 Tax=Croceicoccus gelatinilyticus TaxID=2835536 RepID=UPI001BCD5E07|nr:antibiotic biosynthesis monooxygenase family protein [Croceicoccus gelatinilyticus]MBS7670036.1 antibiotic biosynthesis monooxygenase [Croceicoccus gelatinilyticus]